MVGIMPFFKLIGSAHANAVTTQSNAGLAEMQTMCLKYGRADIPPTPLGRKRILRKGSGFSQINGLFESSGVR